MPGYNIVLYLTLTLSAGSGSVMGRGGFLAPCCFPSLASSVITLESQIPSSFACELGNHTDFGVWEALVQ